MNLLNPKNEKRSKKKKKKVINDNITIEVIEDDNEVSDEIRKKKIVI